MINQERLALAIHNEMTVRQGRSQGVGMRDTMLEFVALENIKRFEHQISRTTDEEERSLILQMLNAERKKLEVARASPI
jgi:hypothetical protein